MTKKTWYVLLIVVMIMAVVLPRMTMAQDLTLPVLDQTIYRKQHELEQPLQVAETNSVNGIDLWINNFGYNAAAGGWRVNQHPRMMADVNGDSRDDIVGFGGAGVYVALSSGSGFSSAQLWVSDFGYDDAAGGWRMDKHLRMMADVNGDGRDDIVGFGGAGVYVALSSGSGFGSVQLWANDFGYDDAAGGWRMDKHLRMMADVNGDGRDDIVGFGGAGVYVSLSSGSGFDSSQLWASNFAYDDVAGGWRVDQHPRTMADVNGDGQDDIVGFGGAGIYVALSTGSGFSSPQLWINDLGYEAGGWRMEMHPRIVADVNGDGKNDVVGFGGAGVYVALSNGSEFSALQLQIEDYGYYAGGWRVDAHPRMMGDVDGDGKFDIIGFGGAGAYVSTDVLSVSPPPQTCEVPFFSQRDPRWENHPLRTDGVCSPDCDTVGKCGCTLTSSAMIFKYYGANINPATLSDCMGNRACPFYWIAGATCSGGKAQWINKYSFSWSHLEQEVGNEHPVILGMHKYVGEKLYTHWVVVLSGSGTSADGYTIHDPWPTNGANMRLSAYSDWYLDYLAVYSGQPVCGSLTSADSQSFSFNAQPIVATMSLDAQDLRDAIAITEAKSLKVSAVVTGTVELYRMTDMTATLQLEAESEITKITEMLIWTDSMAEAAWQPFSNFAYLAVDDEIYARFRDASGNVSEISMEDSSEITSRLTGPNRSREVQRAKLSR